MLVKNILQPVKGIKQGNWVETDMYRGIYISSISSRRSVIATYINKSKKYIEVNTSEITKIPTNKDRRLFSFAKKHILWRKRHDKSKNKSKRGS